jgi:hypothetical protein
VRGLGYVGAMCRRLVIALGVMCLAPLHWCAAMERHEFRWRAALPDGMVSGRLYRAMIPGPVFDGSQSFPADLRVLDEEGNEWPFLIHKPEPPVTRVLRTRVLQRGETNAPSRQLRVELELLDERGRASTATHDRIAISMSGQDFVRRVELLGSADRIAWERVGQGYLIHQMRDRQANVRLLNYAYTDARFLQLRIHPSAHKADEPLEAQAFEVFVRSEAEPPLHAWTVPAEPEAPGAERTGIQTVYLDTGHRFLPVRRIELHAAEPQFARPVKVYGRNDATNQWRWIADGGLHRMAGQERLHVDLRNTPFRFLKVDLFHYEEAPLTLTNATISMEPLYLVTTPQRDAHAHLYFGTDSYELPHYEWARRLRPAQLADAAPAGIDRRERNPHRLYREVWAYGRLLLAATLCIVALLGIGSFLKRMRAS